MFAMRTIAHAESHLKLLKAIKASDLQLFKNEDEITNDFLETFPEYQNEEALRIVVEDDLKNAQAKEKWREFAHKWEKEVDDFNAGVLLRKNVSEAYSDSNTILGRCSFLFRGLTRRHSTNHSLHNSHPHTIPRYRIRAKQTRSK